MPWINKIDEVPDFDRELSVYFDAADSNGEDSIWVTYSNVAAMAAAFGCRLVRDEEN